jgi:hypothetical protein
MKQLGLVVILIGWLGCAGKTPPPAQPPAQEQTPAAPAAQPTQEAALPADPAAPGQQAQAEAPPDAPSESPPPECTVAADCAAKGPPAKGKVWACADSKCVQEKKGKRAQKN